MTAIAIAIRATTLTPFYYHGLYAPDGSATHAEVISDTALCFALAYALGCPPTATLRERPDYKADLQRLPWRSTLLLGERNRALPPVRHTIDAQREGGFQVQVQKAMRSGFFKNTFYVHEVAPGAQYTGLLHGPDPFIEPELIVRIGVGRMGMVRLAKAKPDSAYRLNTATARLLGDDLQDDYRILDTIRVSKPHSPEDAAQCLRRWQ